MKNSLSTFLGLAATALIISILVFGVGFQMLDKEAGEYETQIDNVTNDVPTTSSVTP